METHFTTKLRNGIHLLPFPLKISEAVEVGSYLNLIEC